MDAVLRATAIYMFLVLLMRVSGKRTFAQVTPFDFVLLLIIGEATQQGLLGDDFSVTNALLVVTTLIALDLAAAGIQRLSPLLARVVEGSPVVLVENGQPLPDRLRKARVGEIDILQEARERQGVDKMEDIRLAVLERSGAISVIPRKS